MGQQKSILLVDDEPMVRYTLQMHLEQMGCEVKAVETADAAYALLKQGASFDLLLTDVRMPGSLNGFDLIDLAVEEQPGLKTIAMSGWVGESTAVRPTCDRFIQKPFSVGRLDREIAELLPT